MIREDQLEKYSGILKLLVAILVCIGIVMVYSSSYMYSKEHYGSSLYILWKQLGFVVVGLIGAVIVAKTKYQFWYKYSFYINIALTVLLALTFVPGLGVSVKGANRWISLGIFSFQPGEFIKYSVLILSFFFFDNFDRLETKDKVKYGLNLLAPLVLLLRQPDFGTFFICSVAIGFSCFLSSFSRKVFYGLTVVGAISGAMILFSQPYRVRRLMAFLDPWKDARGSGFQIVQSWIGFANGGFIGKGPGNSLEKLFYLPEAHNDFIFSVIGEEFGFLGVVFLSAVFFLFIFYGFKVSTLLRDRTASLLIALVTFVVGIQATLNMGVVLGLLPTKGLNLPFISYGGSSFVANICAVGLMFACIKREKEKLASGSAFSSYSA